MLVFEDVDLVTPGRSNVSVKLMTWRVVNCRLLDVTTVRDISLIRRARLLTFGHPDDSGGIAGNLRLLAHYRAISPLISFLSFRSKSCNWEIERACVLQITSKYSTISATYAKSLLSTPAPEPLAVSQIIRTLKLQSHIEGGHFAETDRSKFQASTTIFYLLSPGSPVGHFHRNKGRTIHTLHRGRGRYVVTHADEVDGQPEGRARVETFVVGQDVVEGEKLQWIVEGGKFKASFLLEDAGEAESRGGLLISETVVPGFEFADHDFMTEDAMKRLVGPKEFEDLAWLLRRGEMPDTSNLS